MLPSLMYLVVRMLLRVLVPNGPGEAAKDLESCAQPGVSLRPICR